jgi:proteic killer suppression protein
MDVEFGDDELRRLENIRFTGGFSKDIARGFRKALNFIRQAQDERDFYQMKGLGFEKLKGSRAHQHSMRVNKQWRLILEFEGAGPKKIVRLVCIEDYH